MVTDPTGAAAQAPPSRSILLAGLLALLLCCSSDPDPVIVISSPKDGATVETEPNVDGTEVEVEVETEFDVSQFTLAAPGTCGGAPACGHVHIKVDGDDCNDSEAEGKLDFNEEVFASPASANLFYCDGVTIGVGGLLGAGGDRVISFALFGDDELPVKDHAGNPIEASVHVTVDVAQDESGGGGSGGL